MMDRRGALSLRAKGARTALALLLAPLLVSCAAVHRPKTTVPQLIEDAAVSSRAELALRDTVVQRLVRRAVARGDKTLDVLMLSGGGQNGAFGTAFLRGWRTRSGEPMPTFDLITGISTGALQAPFALIGTEAALDTLSVLYREAPDRIAPTFDWWFWLRRTGGLVNTKRYDRALEQAISGPFRDDLRRAFAENRQVVFATTDYDLGVGRTWSLNDELDSTSASVARSRDLLKAATSIPGIFPPVVLDGHVHGDGGVITNVLPMFRYEDFERLQRLLAARGLSDVTVRVYVVMNLWSHIEPRVMSPSDRGEISSRTKMMLFYAHQPQTLELIDALSRAVTAGLPGLRVEFRVATIPSSEALVPGAEKLFDRGYIKRLDSLGFHKATGTTPWDMLPDAFMRSTPPSR